MDTRRQTCSGEDSPVAPNPPSSTPAEFPTTSRGNPSGAAATASRGSNEAGGRHWAWWIALVVAAAFILVPYGRCIAKRGDLTSLIRFGRDFDSRLVPALRAQPHFVYPGTGFDGQFYAQLSADPLLLDPKTAPALDGVTLRARRILLPAVTWTLSGGSPRLVLWIYPLLNLVAWAGLAVMAWRILPRDGRAGPVVFLAIVLGPGAVESASRALPDLPAFVIAFASFGVPALGGAMLLAAAALGRETALLAWPGRLGGLPDWRTNWRRWAVDGTVTVAPLALWMLSLYLRFGFGGRVNGGNFGLPVAGMAGRVGEIAAQFSAHPLAGASDLLLAPPMQSCVLIGSVLVQFFYLVAHPQWRDAAWRWGVLAGLLALCLSWSTWEAFYTVTRHLLPLHLAFNLLLAKTPSPHRWTWFALGNLYVIPRALFWIGFP